MVFSAGREMLARGSFWTFLASGTAVYRPSAGEPVTAQAKRGRTIFRYLSASGQTVRTVQSDFLFRAEDLGREPENGDRIEFEGGVYLVCAPNREPCWCWHGNDTGVYRIHAKKLAEAAS